MTAPPLGVNPADLVVSDEEVMEKFRAAGQGHVFRFLDRLEGRARLALLQSARSVDLDRLERLALEARTAPAGLAVEPLEGARVHRRAGLLENRVLREQAEAAGRELVDGGKVACLTLAGGEGTRLGFDGPKACFPIGPGERTLLDIQAAAVARASQGAARPIPWILLVSPSTEEGIRNYIRRKGLPGVEPASLRIVCQGTLPALDDEGKLLLAAADRIAMAPDGHGGALRALRVSGTLAWLVNMGIEELSCIQVDNPLAPPADPLFLGLHRRAKGQMSSKVFPKARPAEKVGVVVHRKGKPVVIEYTELPEELAGLRRPDGGLVHWAANMAAHVLSLPFAAAVAFRGLPLHHVRKVVPHVGPEGTRVVPGAPNAWKFESFLFDALEMASSGVVLEVDRGLEFAPVKSATGADTPEAARDLLRAAGRW